MSEPEMRVAGAARRLREFLDKGEDYVLIAHHFKDQTKDRDITGDVEDLLQQPAASERCVECGHERRYYEDGRCRAIVLSPSVAGSGMAYCNHRCVFATTGPTGDYERGYVDGHKAGVRLATRAAIDEPSRKEVVEAITDMQEGRDSHQKWFDHLSDHERGDCQGCTEHAEHIGDLDHHRQWIEKYDRVIRLLALVPLSDVVTTTRDAGAGRQLIQDLATFSFDVLMDDAAPRLAIMGSVSALRHMQVRAQELLNPPANAAQDKPPRCPHCGRRMTSDFDEDVGFWRECEHCNYREQVPSAPVANSKQNRLEARLRSVVERHNLSRTHEPSYCCPEDEAFYDEQLVSMLVDELSQPSTVTPGAGADADTLLQAIVESPAGERIRMKCGAADLRSVIIDVIAHNRK